MEHLRGLSSFSLLNTRLDFLRMLNTSDGSCAREEAIVSKNEQFGICLIKASRENISLSMFGRLDFLSGAEVKFRLFQSRGPFCSDSLVEGVLGLAPNRQVSMSCPFPLRIHLRNCCRSMSFKFDLRMRSLLFSSKSKENFREFVTSAGSEGPSAFCNEFLRSI